MVEIVEVGPRDGLQNAPVILSPAKRAQLVVGLLEDCQVPRVEAVSFVHPERVPQMAGAEAVVAGLTDAQRARCCGLVVNERGYARLEATGLPGVRFALAVSSRFHERNTGLTTAAGIKQARRVIELGHDAGLVVGVTLATSFGCPFSGPVAFDAVIELAHDLAQCGVDEIILADTIGSATPRSVTTLVGAAVELGPAVGIHVHDTRRLGHACTLAALHAGASLAESSIGGLGGCPFAPGASGNVATEDLVNLMAGEGIPTAADLEALLRWGEWLESQGLALDSGMQRARPFLTTDICH